MNYRYIKYVGHSEKNIDDCQKILPEIGRYIRYLKTAKQEQKIINNK